MRKTIPVLFVAAFALAWLLKPWWPGSRIGQADDQTVTVAAASDLQLAFGEVGEQYRQETGRQVVFTFGSTGTLAKQIENGAPVDVFAAADVQYVDDLKTKNLILGDTVQIYAVGQLVLAYGKDSGLAVRDLQDLTRPEVKTVAIANPDHAPYGLAARQALEAAGIWDQIKAKVVYGENVRQALQYLQTGNAEAAIVALSIASVPDIDYVPVEKGLYPPINQALGVVSRSRHEQAAREFVAFVTGPRGRSVMKKYGYLLPGEANP